MKKVFLLAVAIATTALVFTSCKKDTTDKGNANISAPTSYTIPTNLSEIAISIGVVAPLDAELESVKIEVVATPAGGSTTTNTLKSLTSFKNNAAYSTVIVNSTDGVSDNVALNYNSTMKSIKITATVKDGGTTTKTITLVDGTTPTDDLDAATAFSWVREGGADGTGFGTLGLKWKLNVTKATFAKIEKDQASKLVILSSTDWTTIKTKADLKTAIDNASGVSEYIGVNVGATANYNDVLGVINNGTYYMIHVTKATISTVTAGTKVTIDGQFTK